MRRTRMWAMVLLVGALAGACSSDSKPAASTSTTTTTASSSASSSSTGEPVFEPFDASNFDAAASADITNPLYPLKAGGQWVYEGSAIENGKKVARRLEFTMTNLTKMIAGVKTSVAWIVDIDDGEIVEKEIAFYAQDKQGTVWYFGEHPEEYENGTFVTAPTWIAGIQEAKPGVKMYASPKLGQPSYYQGWGPAVDWNDFSTIDQTGQETCVPANCYKDVLVIAETSLAERPKNIFQLKYYAAGVGEIRTGYRGDPSEEELQLTTYTPQVDAATLSDVRAQALAVEAHAYQIRKDVYGQTQPAQ